MFLGDAALADDEAQTLRLLVVDLRSGGVIFCQPRYGGLGELGGHVIASLGHFSGHVLTMSR